MKKIIRVAAALYATATLALSSNLSAFATDQWDATLMKEKLEL